jgi:hypothetical protein
MVRSVLLGMVLAAATFGWANAQAPVMERWLETEPH